MNRPFLDQFEVDAADLAVGALTAIAAVGGSLLAVGDSPAFVGAGAAAVLRDALPDLLVAVGIGTLRDLAQPLLAVTAGVLLLGVYAAVAVAAGRYLDGRRRTLATAVLVGAVTLLLAGSTLSAVGAALGAGIALVAAGAAGSAVPRRNRSDGRRRLLRAGAVALGSVLLGAFRSRSGGGGGGEEPPGPPDPAAASLLSVAEERSFSLSGVDGLVSEGFYTVDIATVDPNINPDVWELAVTGEGVNDQSFTLPDLQAFDGERRFVTLRCVSDLINGQKIDTALWDGVPISTVLEAVDAPESCCVTLHCADGYFVSFPREALDPGLLAWGMNGRPLPRAHGAPLRTLVPGHWGETNAKWLMEIEIRDEPEDGYWEQRGWRGTGEVHTVAKLHGVTSDGSTVRVGGHAYAGTRGIDAVEVSTDGGTSWTEATLSETLPGPTPLDAEEPEPAGEAADAWRMWEHEYEASGEHEVVVRAVDGEGTVQPEESQDSYPEGATGWVRETVTA